MKFALSILSSVVFFLFASSAYCAISQDDAKKILTAFEDETVQPVAYHFAAQLTYQCNLDLPFPQPVVASSAERDGDDWSVSIWGASIQHPKMTVDSFVLLVCHELGHQFGAAPWKLDDQGAARWSSAEGQADYYATAICAKRMFEKLPAPPLASLAYPKDITKACRAKIHDSSSAQLCARSIIAAQALVESLSESPIAWTASDPLVVHSTLGTVPDPKDGHYAYPTYPCRMETLRRGALCQAIPQPSTDDLLGTHQDNRYCSDDAGRPACWYSP